MTNREQLKVAIVCDWLTNQGGAERVVLELHRMFPDAPIYTSVFNPDGPGMDAFKDADVRTSFIQYLPWAKTHHQLFPLLRRIAFERFDFSGYDLVISSSGAEAKGIRMPKASFNSSHLSIRNETNPTQTHLESSMKNDQRQMENSRRPLHLNYCHSPTHYYWVRPDEYLHSKTMGWLGRILRLGLRILLKPMRRWDYQAAQRPDVMVANSSLTANRIKRFYDREASVVFPPVDTERFALPKNPPVRKGFVSLGRQVHYMRRDIAVRACTELGLLLRVIGRGPEHEFLKSIAGPTIEFYTDLNDQEVTEALHHAEGLISCGVEDFGITAVEALAAGAPVIALEGSGANDIVNDKTGVFFPEQTHQSLKQTLADFDSKNYNPNDCVKQAQKFSSAVFRRNLQKIIDSYL